MISNSWAFMRDVKNPDSRNQWVFETIKSLRVGGTSQEVLDVAAGEGPFRQVLINQGWTYFSHDNNMYIPDRSLSGLQDERWEYLENDLVCDILDIPEDKEFDLVLCTEVLEHVPDPIRAFQKLTRLVKPGGSILITVPLLSLMHQAPFWFQSGLSPYWFEYWSRECGIAVVEHMVFGDYADLMSQETARFLRANDGTTRLKWARDFAARRAKRSAGLIRRAISPSLRDSAGFGVLFLGERSV